MEIIYKFLFLFKIISGKLRKNLWKLWFEKKKKLENTKVWVLFLTATWFKTFHGSAPILSSLLINASLGTSYLLICRSTVIDWLCTPPTLQKTRMAPSRTRKALSTSIVKSTWPGVSIILICNKHEKETLHADYKFLNEEHTKKYNSHI